MHPLDYINIYRILYHFKTINSTKSFGCSNLIATSDRCCSRYSGKLACPHLPPGKRLQDPRGTSQRGYKRVEGGMGIFPVAVYWVLFLSLAWASTPFVFKIGLVYPNKNKGYRFSTVSFVFYLNSIFNSIPPASVLLYSTHSHLTGKLPCHSHRLPYK